MQKRIYSWLGREFIELSGEARAAASVEDETKDLFRCFEQELKSHGLSLQNTVRTRAWGKDREARTLATAARAKILTGDAKAASSSYISPSRFDSDARVALDLLAMRPSRPDAERKPVEFVPPRNYLCYLRCDSVIFVSGYTSDLETLQNQVPQIVEAVASGLMVAASDWSHLVKLSFFLHRSQKIETLRELLEKGLPKPPDMAKVEFGVVDGYAGEKSLLEVEATAVIRS
jgi:enamine deaminase RidA (YjgF/YER057c/UK114 family)